MRRWTKLYSYDQYGQVMLEGPEVWMLACPEIGGDYYILYDNGWIAELAKDGNKGFKQQKRYYPPVPVFCGPSLELAKLACESDRAEREQRFREQWSIHDSGNYFTKSPKPETSIYVSG